MTDENLSKVNKDDSTLVDKETGEDWVDKAKKEYGGVKEKDADVYKINPIKVEDQLVADMPEKLNIVGPIGETSVKKDGPRHNPLHGKDGKVMVKENVKSKPVAKP